MAFVRKLFAEPIAVLESAEVPTSVNVEGTHLGHRVHTYSQALAHADILAGTEANVGNKAVFADADLLGDTVKNPCADCVVSTMDDAFLPTDVLVHMDFLVEDASLIIDLASVSLK